MPLFVPLAAPAWCGLRSAYVEDEPSLPAISEKIEPDWLEINHALRKVCFGSIEQFVNLSGREQLVAHESDNLIPELALNECSPRIEPGLLAEQILPLLRGHPAVADFSVQPFDEFFVTHCGP
jgi:hypothetical protein